MTTFFDPNEAIEVDFTESRTTRNKNRAACFLHLRDLVYLHPRVASSDAVAFVLKFEAAVMAEKAAREKRLAVERERGERRREADRQKAEAEQAEDRARPSGSPPHLWGRIRPPRGPR
jgi:hypothetical protein